MVFVTISYLYIYFIRTYNKCEMYYKNNNNTKNNCGKNNKLKDKTKQNVYLDSRQL